MRASHRPRCDCALLPGTPSKIAISRESFEVPRQRRLTPAERVLDSENAIGEESSVTFCRSIRARCVGHVSSIRSPLIVNGIKLLQETFPCPASYTHLRA